MFYSMDRVSRHLSCLRPGSHRLTQRGQVTPVWASSSCRKTLFNAQYFVSCFLTGSLPMLLTIQAPSIQRQSMFTKNSHCLTFQNKQKSKTPKHMSPINTDPVSTPEWLLENWGIYHFISHGAQLTRIGISSFYLSHIVKITSSTMRGICNSKPKYEARIPDSTRITIL